MKKEENEVLCIAHMLALEIGFIIN